MALTAHEGQDKAKSRIKWTREQRLAAWANAASFMNAAAAAAAFALLFLTLQATQDSLTASRNAVAEAHEQAVQAQHQAEIASKQLAVASETEFRQLRAYVGIDTITLRPIANGSQVTAEITLKNYGVTPANFVKIIARTTISLDRTSPDKVLERTALGSSFSLFPSATKMFVSPGEQLNAWDAWQSAQSVTSVLVFGRIEYATVFSSDQRPQIQTTRFCIDAYQTGAKTPEACQKYNQAD